MGEEMTRAMVAALKAVNLEIPSTMEALSDGSMPVAKQLEFATLLIELGQLLADYADVQARGD
jgi:hypothetical protein